MPFPRTAPCDDPSLMPLQARYRAAMAKLPSGAAAAGLRLLERIAGVNWLLEWNLPGWLGKAFDLPPAVTGELTLGNIYGLAFVRLQDDLFDHERGNAGGAAAGLAGSLHNLWMGQYHPLFERESNFWEHLDRYTGQWLRASLDVSGPDGAALRSGQAGAMQRLADRGAPLKVCCAAAGMLAGRETLLPQLLDAIDHHLAGAVLVDHLNDWQADLSSGRYNAFVSFMMPDKQAGQGQDATRQAVLEELYLGEAAGPYFELARQQFKMAGGCVEGLEIVNLEAYLEWVDVELTNHYERLVQTNSQRLRNAARDLLGSMEQVDLFEV